LDGGGPLLVEHPEQSLHPAVVRYLPGLIWRTLQRRDRQVLISTNSADLLSDQGIGLDEILILQPSREGTQIWQAFALADIPLLFEAGVPIEEILGAWTAPRDAQLLFRFNK
jgi:hypothetical protein